MTEDMGLQTFPKNSGVGLFWHTVYNHNARRGDGLDLSLCSVRAIVKLQVQLARPTAQFWCFTLQLREEFVRCRKLDPATEKQSVKDLRIFGENPAHEAKHYRQYLS